MTEESRIPPIEKDDLSMEQRRVYDAVLASRGSLAGPFAAWLHHPELADRAQSLGELIRYRSSLEPRLREIAILTVARFWNAAVEWSIHEPEALRAGVSADVIGALREGGPPDFGPKDERAVHSFARELLDRRAVSDESFESMRAAVGTVGAVELTVLVGYYTLVAFTLNAFRLPVPEGVKERLPPLDG